MAIHIIFFCRSRILSIQCPPLLRTGWSICPPTFPICIFIITTTTLDDECNPKLFDMPKSLTGLFQSMVMLLFFNVLFLSFLNAVSDSPLRSGHIEVQNWANGPQCSWLCTSFMNFLCSPNLRPILTIVCKVFDIHIINSSLPSN